MKSVVLTGAGGFVGRTTIKLLLERGYEVHAITSRLQEESFPNLFYHQIDLLNGKSRAHFIESVKPSHLLHLAWYVEHGKFWDAPENAEWVNASFGLLNDFAKHGGKRVVMAGTCAEYDWQKGEKSFSEASSIIDPATIYGKAKRDLYLGLRDFAATASLSYAWGRIFFLYGQYELRNRFIPSIIRSLLQDKDAECSHGEQVRDFMFVEDAGEAFVKLLDSGVQGAVNIADGTPRKMKDIAETIARIMGKPQLLKLGARAVADNEPATLVADVGRLRNEVKFEKRTNLNTAIEKTIDWWTNNL